MSTTTRSNPRSPASSTAASASAGTAFAPSRPDDRTATPPTCGSAWSSDAAPSRPRVSDRSAHRTPGQVLDAEQDVDAAADRVRVDEQHAQRPRGRCQGEGRGERGGTGATAGTDHRDDRPAPGRALPAVGQSVDQPALRVREAHHMLRTQAHGTLPVSRGGLVAHQDDVATPREPGGRDRAAHVGPDQHHRRQRPAAPRRLRVRRQMHLDPVRGGQAQDVVDEVRRPRSPAAAVLRSCSLPSA